MGEILGCLLWCNQYSLVLYEDGQLIIYDRFAIPHGFLETKLTPLEINTLFLEIANTGFFQTEGTGAGESKDPIYDINQPVDYPAGAPSEQFSVRDRSIIITNGLEKYLKKPIKETLDIIQNYHPTNLKRYIPQRLTLWVVSSSEYFSDYTRFGTPVPPKIPWPADLPRLSSMQWPTILDGQEAAELVKQYSFFPCNKIFTQGGKDYLVAACPDLP